MVVLRDALQLTLFWSCFSKCPKKPRIDIPDSETTDTNLEKIYLSLVTRFGPIDAPAAAAAGGGVSSEESGVGAEEEVVLSGTGVVGGDASGKTAHLDASAILTGETSFHPVAGTHMLYQSKKIRTCH